MDASEQQKLVEQIHASSHQLVLSLTGGGSGAIAALLQVPGASASVLEVVVPYSAKAFDGWIGGAVDRYCSEQTARDMAMRAFERARELSNAEPSSLCGVGATASLATNRPKRGAHRIHVAWQSATTTAVASCNFTSSDSSRQQEETTATQLILHAVAEACGVHCPPPVAPLNHIQISRRQQLAPDSWTELLLGRRNSVLLSASVGERAPAILFPGAFNPPHWGHERMAEIASERCGQPVAFELSITNVDKRPLDFIEIASRAQQLTGRPLLLTRAPTFVEKSKIAPGCVFVVGADTIQRIGDTVYYDGSAARRDTAIAEIADRGCRFLVFGRAIGGGFSSLSSLDIPSSLRAICVEVPESEFSADVSSTELRAKSAD